MVAQETRLVSNTGYYISKSLAEKYKEIAKNAKPAKEFKFLWTFLNLKAAVTVPLQQHVVTTGATPLPHQMKVYRGHGYHVPR